MITKKFCKSDTLSRCKKITVFQINLFGRIYSSHGEILEILLCPQKSLNLCMIIIKVEIYVDTGQYLPPLSASLIF